MKFPPILKIDSNSTSQAYRRQVSEWEMINSLIGGTGVIRLHGTKYLPQKPNETLTRYNNRLSKAVLNPFFKKTSEFMTGKALYKGIEINDDAPDIMKQFVDDVDSEQNNLSSFGYNAFFDSWSKGLGFFYVDAPEPSGEIRTQADFQNMNVRPYIKYVKPESVLDIVFQDGVIVFVKLLEVVQGFSDEKLTSEESNRIRIVTQSEIAIYDNTSNTDSQEYKLTSVIPNPMGFVPLIPVYTGKILGNAEAVPPLLDLAYSNVQYYQDKSTHEDSIEIAEFPILAMTGTKTDDIVIGSHKIISLPDPQSDLKYIEHSGNALEAGRKNLEELRIEMAYAGLFTVATDGASHNVTATESAIRNINENSTLKSASNNFVDAINKALWYVELFFGISSISDKPKTTATMEGSFSLSQNDVKQLTLLFQLEEAGKLRLQTLYQELQRQGALSEKVDIDTEVQMAGDTPTL